MVTDGTVEKGWKVGSDAPWPAPLLPDPGRGMVNAIVRVLTCSTKVKLESMRGSPGISCWYIFQVHHRVWSAKFQGGGSYALQRCCLNTLMCLWTSLASNSDVYMCWLLSPTHTKCTMTYCSFITAVTLAIFTCGVMYVGPLYNAYYSTQWMLW